MTTTTSPSGLFCQPRFESVQEAWRWSLAAILKHGSDVPGVRQSSSIGSGFGSGPRGFRELIATSFVISSPRRRLTLSQKRPIDLGYALANVLWVLSGSDSVDAIQFYNPKAADFSDDGTTLLGAPGARIFRSLAGDQFEQAARRLLRDPSSRRAVIEAFMPSDLSAETRDCSCLTYLQFLVRDGAVDCIANMRSQSVLMVMPYDLVLLTMIHELMAVRLGLKLGAYIHNCGSFHYYHDEDALVRNVLAESSHTPPEMPQMVVGDDEVCHKLIHAERRLRTHLLANPAMPIHFDDFGLDAYWRGYLAAMVAGVSRRRGLTQSIEENVPEAYVSLLRAR